MAPSLPGGGCFFLVGVIGGCWHFLLGFLHTSVDFKYSYFLFLEGRGGNAHLQRRAAFPVLPESPPTPAGTKPAGLWPVPPASFTPVSRSGGTCLCPSPRRPLAKRGARVRPRGKQTPAAPEPVAASPARGSAGLLLRCSGSWDFTSTNNERF